MNQTSKKILLVVSIVILLIPVGLYVFIQYVFDYSNEQYTVKAEYGDQFDVEYDGYKCRSNIFSSESEFSLTVNGKINKEDFIGLIHTDSVTMYELDGLFIFNNGGGFKEFTYESVNSVPDVAEMVKSRLLTSYDIYVNNIDYFFKNSKYKAEIEHMIENIQKDKYEELSQYGLTEDVINDRCTLTNIKYEISHPRNNI